MLAGIAAALAFVLVERRRARPMLPLELFRIREFSAANAVTFLLYAANSAALLLLVIELETVAGFSPLMAGAGLLPITGIMLVLAAPFGALAVRIGPRLPMTVGPLISATGLAMLTRLDAASQYVSDVLPAVCVFGLGLAVFVAPLTATVLGAVPADRAGLAAGVNNAVARSAGLIAIAALPAVVGLTGDAYADAGRLLSGFHEALWICAALQACGGLLAAAAVTGNVRRLRGRCSVSTAGQPVAAAAVPSPNRPRHDDHG
jgi:hypothetical protein